MPEPFNFRNDRKKPKGWERQESRLAKDFDGKLRAGSGNQVRKKGDVIADYVLIEAKSTKFKSISLKQSWLKKIDEEAVTYDGRFPALGVTFTNMDPGTEKDWIILPKWAVLKMLKAYKDEDKE